VIPLLQDRHELLAQRQLVDRFGFVRARHIQFRSPVAAI
jgi:hypothetical protein